MFQITFQLNKNKLDSTYALYITPKKQWFGFVFIIDLFFYTYAILIACIFYYDDVKIYPNLSSKIR